MSILNKLKAAKDAKELKLHDAHPLAQESHDSRLRYLSAVSWALGLDREPLPIEQDAFVALADSLSVDAGDARELLAERANVTEGDMATMLEMAKSQKFVYLLDVCWMLVMDGKVEAAEREFLEGIAPMVEVEKKVVDNLLELLFALLNKDMPLFFKYKWHLRNVDGLNLHLRELMWFSQKRLVDVVYKKPAEKCPHDGVWAVEIGSVVEAGSPLCNIVHHEGIPMISVRKSTIIVNSRFAGVVAGLESIVDGSWGPMVWGTPHAGFSEQDSNTIKLETEGRVIAKIYVPE